MERFTAARASRRVPVVLSRGECHRLFEALTPTTGLMAELTYGSVLRLMELLRLRVKDADLERGWVIVRAGRFGSSPPADQAPSKRPSRLPGRQPAREPASLRTQPKKELHWPPALLGLILFFAAGAGGGGAGGERQHGHNCPGPSGSGRPEQH